MTTEDDAPFTPADLTVSISTIDRPAFFTAAIESVMATAPAEVSLQIVLNEASAESLSIATAALARWSGPTRLITIDRRADITQSHQRALDECSTRLVNFMGDDDLCLGPRFERVIEHFNEIEALQVVGSWVMRAGGDARHPRLVGKSDIGPPTIEEWERHQALHVPVQVNFPSAVFLVAGLHQVGGFEQRYAGAFDKAVIGKMARLGPVIALQERDFAFRIHNSSDSATNFFELAQRAHYIDSCFRHIYAGEPEPTFEKFLEQSRQRPWRERARERRRDRARFYFRRAGAAWANGDRTKAVISTGRAALVDPFALGRKILEQRGRPDDFQLG